MSQIAYLQAYGFQTWIVSGGGIEFMRPWTERVYGIGPQQVIGSSINRKYEIIDGEPVIVRQPKISFINDKQDKPISIWQHIGRRPIAAYLHLCRDRQCQRTDAVLHNWTRLNLLF